MTPHEKANQTMKAQLLQIIREFPGIKGTDEVIPNHLRRFLKEMQQVDKTIRWNDGWFPTTYS